MPTVVLSITHTTKQATKTHETHVAVDESSCAGHVIQSSVFQGLKNFLTPLQAEAERRVAELQKGLKARESAGQQSQAKQLLLQQVLLTNCIKG